MQAAPRPPGQPPSVKIYNAVYSSVQVYECMVRGIAVMRRRADSYVNATQILKVAGVDKGRRTKILEKEILPGKHEIVQGGYGKYQGTWIPLERGRDLSVQYGIGPLLSPLFDFTPNSNPMGSLPGSLANLQGLTVPRPLSASASFSGSQASSTYSSQNQIGSAPIMPGSALRLLNQGRAQGLFTPSTSSLLARSSGSPGYYPGLMPGFSPQPTASPTPSSGQQPSLKRTWTDSEIELGKHSNGDPTADKSSALPTRTPGPLEASPDIIMTENTRSTATMPPEKQLNGVDRPSPSKRARVTPPNEEMDSQTTLSASQQIQSQISTSQSQSLTNGSNSITDSLSVEKIQGTNGARPKDGSIRFSTTPQAHRSGDKSAPLKDAKRSAIMASICQKDDPDTVVELIKDASNEPSDRSQSRSQQIDYNIIIDDLGHTPLHLAASLARLKTVESLVTNGADVYRGNHQGETPLIRSTLSTHNFDSQTFNDLLTHLYTSIRTIDTAKRSVLHHVALSAGVKGRAPFARYYLEGVLTWIAQREGGEFRSLVDIQDEHGDTALNIAARVGNRSIVRSLMDVGANRTLANKLGLRPGDFGVESEELAAGPRAEDLLSSLRTGPSLPIQKSQDVITDMTSMIQDLSADFSSEIKIKQDAFDVTQAHLRAATRELADQRRQIQAWQNRCGELDQVAQRIRNLEKAIIEEDKFDWTGRTEVNGEPAKASAAFTFRGPSSTMAALGGSLDISFNLETEPPIPTSDSISTIVRLRRMLLWQRRIADLMEDRLKNLKGASAEKEFQCKKIVALCAGISIDRVEGLLENLVIAVESDSQIVDIARVSGFMQKVRDGAL